MPYNEKTDAAKEISAHHFSGCPVDHKKQQFYVSQAVGNSLKATVSLLANNIVYINDIFVDRLESRGQVLPHFSHVILTEKDANA